MLPLWDVRAPQPSVSIACSGALPSNHVLAASGTETSPGLWICHLMCSAQRGPRVAPGALMP